VFRAALGKVTVELKRGVGDDAIAAVLREALRQAEGQPGDDQVAA
jgi:hypothetical protein